MKFYAVKEGRITGIYYNWEDTKRQVDGYPGAIYQSFATKKEADAFMAGEIVETTSSDKTPHSQIPKNHPKNVLDNNLTNYAGVIYTDGGSRNTGNIAGGHVKNSDKAAWAYLIQYGQHQASASAGEFGATNNKMEITALIKAMQKLIKHNLNQEKLLFILDSRYVLDAINQKWIYGWAKRNWTRSGGELKNADLWQEVYRLLPQFKNATFEWTKGHANNQGNIFVDELLNQTMDRM